jgi:hypothetical protein
LPICNLSEKLFSDCAATEMQARHHLNCLRLV